MVRRLRLPLFVATAALLAGCFQVDAVLTVRPDGSAELRETLSGGSMFGYMFRQTALEAEPGADRSATHGAGVTVRSVEVDAMPGRAVVTTVYDVPDVSALRYDISTVGDIGEGNGLFFDGDTMDESDADAGEPMPGSDTLDADSSTYRFAFTPGTGGEAARLLVTVPVVADLPDAGDFQMLDMLGADVGEEGPSLDDMMVLMGDARMRFAVRAATVESADAGWHDGDTVTFADIDLGSFIEYLTETGATPDSVENDDPSQGFALPGYRVAPTGTATIRFR